MKAPLQLTGVGLRSLHYTEILEKQPPIAWFEVHSENYFAEGGKPLHYLEKIRAHYPISFHGVSLSIGSTDELNWQHLKMLKDLIHRFDPCLVSDHLSWSSLNGQYFHDLFPLAFTQETLQQVSTRIQKVQEYLGRQILIENISSYVKYQEASFEEAAFLVEIARQSGCGILLDINNIYVSANNLKFDALKYIDHIPSELVQELHLAGFRQTEIDQQSVLIDTHDQLIVPAVWDLYRYAITRLGVKPTIIEWDKNIPAFDTLYLEAYRAEKIMRENQHYAKQAI